ncbi:nitroreductase family deazaflavin-dependent oxidoreductase [Gordonia sp. SID5947]|uniref:nitroreductase/quinone reductase family protein n=1 Tax=Gordonia sp. SID5947 TaxID=2690315 RepID=UPI00136EB976|nr:nitroreductase/quinone reductase family protein [Gordonia sp. SID5947]MYR06059.1 nitroreductase family deazaflavin-dependent oxidoreductase [Gordonia sp. SID5947]
MKRRAFVLVNRATNAVVGRIRPRRFRGADLLMLTTTGRKSGAQRTTPLIYMPDDDRWIVVASNGGGDWEPGWWLNLKAGSAAEIAIGDVVTPVRGTEITGAEREQMWRTLNEKVFDFQGYQDKVSRRIAVVALTPSA